MRERRARPLIALGECLEGLQLATRELERDPKNTVALRDYNFAFSKSFMTRSSIPGFRRSPSPVRYSRSFLLLWLVMANGVRLHREVRSWMGWISQAFFGRMLIGFLGPTL